MIRYSAPTPRTHPLILRPTQTPFPHRALPCPARSYVRTRSYVSALRSLYASLGRELVAFERHLSLRNKGGNHCHINVLGVTPEAGR